MLVEGLGFSSHASCGCKYKWGEDTMFDFKYTLAISSLLFIFMFLVRCREAPGAVAGCIWVEYPHVKVRILTTSPETSGPNVELCSIISVGRGQLEGFP